MKQHLKKYLECLDSMTFMHSVRVMLIAGEVEEHMGLSDHLLMNAALFHDIGKLYIPRNILDKNGCLTKLERDLIDLHPYIGYTLMSNLGVNEDICRIILYHHGFKPSCIRELEHYEYGSIYQRASILHTIDSFEALTSDRPYHRGVTSKQAINILLKEKNFDETAMEYLINVCGDKHMKSSAVRRGGKEISMECVEKLIDKMELQ